MVRNRLIILLILFLHVSVLILHHVFGYIGHYGFDDLHYAKLANDLTNGIIDYNDQFTYRFPLVILTAVSYSLFGVSDFASSLPSLIIAILILVLVFLILRKESYLTLIMGLSLTVFSNWFLFYSDKLMPDIYVAFSVILSLFILHKYKFGSNKKYPALYSVLLAFALLFGFTAKGTIILILPLLLYIFIIDFIFKRDIRFWTYFIISGVLILTLYFLIIWVLTGDFVARFKAIAENSYLNLCSYDQQPFGITLKRISFEFFNLMTYQAMMSGFILIIAFLFRNRIASYFQLNDSFSFFFVSSIILFLSSNFMTISATSYIPVCLDPRHFLFLIPVVSIPASVIITDYIKEKQNAIPIILVLFLISILSFFLQGDSFWKLYMPFTILFGLYYLLKTSNKYQSLFTLLFVAILLVQAFGMIKYAQKVKYWKQKEIVYEYVLNKSEDYYVITNEVQKRLGNYYSGFNENSNTLFLSYGKFNLDSLDNRKKLLFLNSYSMYLSNYSTNDLPFYARNIDPLNKLIYENVNLNISIYELNRISTPGVSRTKILHSFNGFEQKIPNWNQNDVNVTDNIKYEGNQSIRVKEYSSTFSYPFDSLEITSSNNILISCELLCYYLDNTNSQLVISIENEAGVYIWKGLEINKYLKAYSNWWPVNFEIEINANEIKDASLIKVYLWNIDKKTAYIDNFDITIVEIEN